MPQNRWPYRESRISAERLRREGVTPDPSWRYDRSTDTYSSPLVRDAEKTPASLPLREGVALPSPPDNLLRETRLPARANVTLTEAKNAAGKTVTRFKCVVAQVDIVNRNGKYYPRSAYQAAIDAAQTDMAEGKLWALIEHADDWFDPMKGRLEKIAGLFDTLLIEGDDVVGGGVIIDNSSGKDITALFDAGVAVGISTSGTASIKWLPAKEVDATYHDPEALIGVVQDDYRLLTIDFVSDPANPAGRASREQRTRTNREERMHPKIKALLKQHNVTTVEELKKVAAEAYYSALEDIAQESVATPPAPQPAPAAGVSLTDYRALEETVVELRGQVTALTTDNHNGRRDAIALTALEGARLPAAGKIKRGETEIDLDASFRAELTEAARNASSDEAAREAVATKIATRQAMQGQQESQPKPGSNRLSIPSGDNNRSAESAKSGDARQLESTRRSFGLI